MKAKLFVASIADRKELALVPRRQLDLDRLHGECRRAGARHRDEQPEGHQGQIS